MTPVVVQSDWGNVGDQPGATYLRHRDLCLRGGLDRCRTCGRSRDLVDEQECHDPIRIGADEAGASHGGLGRDVLLFGARPDQRRGQLIEPSNEVTGDLLFGPGQVGI